MKLLTKVQTNFKISNLNVLKNGINVFDDLVQYLVDDSVDVFTGASETMLTHFLIHQALLGFL